MYEINVVINGKKKLSQTVKVNHSDSMQAVHVRYVESHEKNS